MLSAWKLDTHANCTFLITSNLLEGKNLISLHIFFLFGNFQIFSWTIWKIQFLLFFRSGEEDEITEQVFFGFKRNNKEDKMAVRADVGFMRADAEEIMKRIQMNSGVIGVSVIDCNGKFQLWRCFWSH